MSVDWTQELLNRQGRERDAKHEELQANTTSILNDVKTLQTRRAALPAGDPGIAEIDKALAEHQQAFSDLYHPIKNPGALAKLGGFLKQHIGGQAPKPAPKSNEVTPQRMAGLEASAAGTQLTDPYLTPEELKKKARIAAKLDPPATDKPLMKPYRVNGVIAYYDANHPETIPQGASAVVAGGTPKPLKFDPPTDEVIDQNTGDRFKRGDPNAPQEAKDMFAGAKTTQDAKQKNALELARTRGASYGLNRPISVYDSAHGNAPREVLMGDIKREPDRYIPTGAGAKALQAENYYQDTRGASDLTRDAINGMTGDFPVEARAKIALAMRADDPHAALDQLLASAAIGSLTDDQQNLLIATRQLAENAMSLRTTLGAGQGAEDVRDAIRATLPTLLSPNKAFALKQLDAFNATIERLHRGTPRVTLPNTNPGDLKKNAASSAGQTKTYQGHTYNKQPDGSWKLQQ